MESGLAMPHFISPLDPFSIFLHLNINTTKILKNPSFFRKYLRNTLVIVIETNADRHSYIKLLFVELIKLVYDKLRIYKDILQEKLVVNFRNFT